MADTVSPSPKHLQVENGWLGRVLAFLEDHKGSDARADRLLREAPISIQDRLVAIRRLDLNNPAHMARLRDEQPD